MTWRGRTIGTSLLALTLGALSACGSSQSSATPHSTASVPLYCPHVVSLRQFINDVATGVKSKADEAAEIEIFRAQIQGDSVGAGAAGGDIDNSIPGGGPASGVLSSIASGLSQWGTGLAAGDQSAISNGESMVNTGLSQLTQCR